MMRLLSGGVVAAASFALAACGVGEGNVTAIDAGLAVATQKSVPTSTIGVMAQASEQPPSRETESDRLWLATAASACRNKEFKDFFRAFSGSRVVRARYTAPIVDVGDAGKSIKMNRARYIAQKNYPLAMVDHFFVTAQTARPFSSTDGEPNTRRYVQVEINQSSDNRGRVDWLPGIFEINLRSASEEPMEGLGDLLRKTGPGGYLLFRPNRRCWELVEDITFPPTSK